MPSKEEILSNLRAGRAELEAELARLSPAIMLQSGTCGEWSVKDLMGHLVAWEQHMLADFARLFAGQPVREFSGWDEVNAINAATFARYRDVPLAEIQAEFARSYNQVEEWVESATDEQLSTPYLWQMTVGEFIRIDTWTHYSDHIDALRAVAGSGRG